jgi:two-component system cell cycle response regulator DivK
MTEAQNNTPTTQSDAAAQDTQPAAMESSTAKIVAKHIDPGEAHVLVVEDNVPNFVLIARMLAFMGVQRCEWKTSGWQVVQFADTLPRVDLILMDIRLPYEDGYQALQKVRTHPRLRDTIVCAVTAEASEDQLRKAKKAGFNGFLGKPLDADRFPSQIRRLLAGEEVWEWK